MYFDICQFDKVYICRLDIDDYMLQLTDFGWNSIHPRQLNKPHFTEKNFICLPFIKTLSNISNIHDLALGHEKLVMFDCRSVAFKAISHSRALATRLFVLLLWRHGVEWDCDVIADIDNGWDECISPIWTDIYAWNIRFDSRRFFFFLYSML